MNPTNTGHRRDVPLAQAELRTLHPQSGGAFVVAGETVQAARPRG